MLDIVLDIIVFVQVNLYVGSLECSGLSCGIRWTSEIVFGAPSCGIIILNVNIYFFFGYGMLRLGLRLPLFICKIIGCY